MAALTKFLIAWSHMAAVSVASVDQSLSLSLELNQQEYVVGEPMTATFFLINKGGPTKTRNQFSLNHGLRLSYRHQDETAFRNGGPATGLIRESWNVSGTAIGANTVVSVSVLLAHNGSPEFFGPRELRHLFAAVAGVYHFKATMKIDGDTTLESNVVTVGVRDPSGEDSQAWELWKNLLVTWAVQGNALPSDADAAAGLVKLEELLVRFPDSIYARYARPRLSKDIQIPPQEKASVQGAFPPAPPSTTVVVPHQAVSARPTPAANGAIHPLFLFVGAGVLVALLVWWLRRR